MTEYVTLGVIDYAAPASTGTYATPAPVIECAAPAHTVTFTAPSPMTEDVAPAPSSSCAAPASVIEHVAPATTVTVNAYVARAPVIDYIALPPAVFHPSFSQQLPPTDTNEPVAVEASAPQDVGSLLTLNEQIVDIPFPWSVEEIKDVSVQLGTHPINDCIQSLKISEEQVAKLEEVTSSLRSRSQVLIKSPGSRQAARHAQNELDLVVAQLREEQQSLHDKKQLLAEALREKQHLLNMKRRRLDI